MFGSRVSVFLRAAAEVLLLGVASWGIGLSSYRLALWLLYRQVVSSGDWPAVVFWSGLMFITVMPVPLWLLTMAVHERTTARRRFVLVPLAVGLVSLVPTWLLAVIWGSRKATFSPEAALFFILFATAAVSFAIGFELIHWRD